MKSEVEANKIKDLQVKLDEIKLTLSLEQQKLFSLGSVQNYLNFFNHIEHYHDDVLKLLMEYFQVMETVDYNIDKEGSRQIGIDYIMKIGYYYNAEAGFKMEMKLDFIIFWGLLADALLFIIGLLKMIHYVPIVTTLLFIHWLRLKLFYKKRNKIYDIGY